MEVGVNEQRKTRGEAVDIGVGVWHGAHIVVRESVKLHIRVLLPWVRCGSRTMRDVICKDGKGVCCGVRCSGQRLSRGQSAWAEERNTGKVECLEVWGETRGECMIAVCMGTL